MCVQHVQEVKFCRIHRHADIGYDNHQEILCLWSGQHDRDLYGLRSPSVQVGMTVKVVMLSAFHLPHKSPMGQSTFFLTVVSLSSNFHDILAFYLHL